MDDGQQLFQLIQAGDVERLGALLAARPQLVDHQEDGRSVLHLATHWPGKWPRVAETIEVLVKAGAEVNIGAPHPTNPDVCETPLHWAASSGDVAAVEALLDAGADVDSLGGIFGGCTPFEEAVIFRHYNTAQVLLDRGATSYLPGEAALGRFEQVRRYFNGAGELRMDIGQLPNWETPPPAQVILDRAFQFACRAGHIEIAKFLEARGADRHSKTPVDTTALDEATKEGHDHVVAWLSA